MPQHVEFPSEGLETAILIDLENLIGGYKPTNYADQVNLKQLMDAVEAMSMVGRVAVKRAYANWAHYTLKPLREQVARLGIEPVQMFSLGWGSAKNASDLQIAIDAMDLALSRPSIQAFLIVSGDGGFASLACRLRSHGKLVGGAAYKLTKSEYFKKQCDEWVELTPPEESPPDPTQQRPQVAAGILPWIAKSQPKEPSAHVSPVLKEFRRAFKRTSPTNAGDMQAASVSAVRTIAECQSAARALDGQGLDQNEVMACLKAGIVDFSPSRAGVPKMSQLLATSVTGTDLQLIQGSSGQGRLQRRGLTPPEGYTLVDDLEAGPIHESANYRNLLASAKLWTPSEVTSGQVVDALVTMDPDSKAHEDAILERLTTSLGCSEKDARTSLRVLTRAGVLGAEVEGEASEVTLIVTDPEEARGLVTAHLQSAMTELMPDYEMDVLREVVG